MSGLLDYLVEQAKDIDPAAFTLPKATEFEKTYADLETLPWIDFNVDTDGDPIWLRVHRLEAMAAPSLSEPDLAPYLAIADDPEGRPPALKEAALESARNEDTRIVGEDEAGLRDEQCRARVGHLLAIYTQHWTDWAARERDVYLELFGRGYRVIPQVPAAGYRIDMVVEGTDDRRLAIELDGDEFHGPDRWAADMGRQRVLERAGWIFWRCFASTWSLQRETVLAELLQQLANMGIEPLGALERIPSLVEYREWGREAGAADAMLESALADGPGS